MSEFVADLRRRFPDGEFEWLWPFVLIIVGLAIATLASALGRRAAQRVADGRVSILEGAVQGLGPKASLPAIAAPMVFWSVFIFFVWQAATTADLGVFSDMVDSAVRILPVIALGSAILLAGAVAGDWLATLAGALAEQSSVVPRTLASAIVRISSIIGSAIVAFDTIGLATILPVTVVSLLVAAILTLVVAAVIVASRGVLANIAAARYVEETYLEGEQVMFQNTPAEIQAIGLLATELITEAGVVIRVPNQVLVTDAA